MALPDGRERPLVFSAKKITTEYTEHTECQIAKTRTAHPLGIVYSDDDGASWREAQSAKLSAMMPPTGFMPLRDGTVALFGQMRLDASVVTDGPEDDQVVWMATSRDGLAWGEPRIVASAPEKNLCEPFAMRSPDGREIALLLRENRHAGRSMMCFSRDEGATWTEPVDTCGGLTGDRHEGVVLPDGRVFIAFRDRASNSPTYGHYVAWVGTWDDLRNASPGQCRIKLLHSHAGEEGIENASFLGDTGYSGVELLADGEILCTTYVKYWPDARRHSVVSTRVPMQFLNWKLENGTGNTCTLATFS